MKLKSYSEFNKQERSGIFFLLLLLIFVSGVYFFIKGNRPKSNSSFLLDTVSQKQIDSLRLISGADSVRIFPFNPNFISDFKGYSLGMSVAEIDRLHQFRASNRFVNSSEEFQKVTLVSDSLLKVISPYFKFPEWTKKQKEHKVNFKLLKSSDEELKEIKDINVATAKQLRSIRGIGEKLSARIIKFRDRLGGFLVNDQLYDVYGLEIEVADRALAVFQVIDPPTINKININTATTEEIAGLVYIPYHVAEKIVEYRSFNGKFEQLTDLLTIEGYPKDKSARIELYLTL